MSGMAQISPMARGLCYTPLAPGSLRAHQDTAAVGLPSRPLQPCHVACPAAVPPAPQRLSPIACGGACPAPATGASRRAAGRAGRWPRCAGGTVGPPRGGVLRRVAGGAAPKGRLQFLLCCRCCQALVNDFFPSTCSALSHGLKGSGGFRWRWDPSPPTTFAPCERQHPSPDALCVLRRERAVLGEATPSLRRLV